MSTDDCPPGAFWPPADLPICQPRKAQFIQLFAHNSTLYALDENGGVWYLFDGYWTKLKDQRKIPADPKPETILP